MDVDDERHMTYFHILTFPNPGKYPTTLRYYERTLWQVFGILLTNVVVAVVLLFR